MIENINLLERDSSKRVDIIIDCLSNKVKVYGDIRGWRIGLDTSSFIDTSLYEYVKGTFETPFTNVAISNVKDLDLYVNGRVDENVFGHKDKQLTSYSSIVIYKPTAFYGWAQLQILALLTQPLWGNASEYRRLHQQYQSSELMIPIIVVKSDGDHTDNNNVRANQYVVLVHIYTDSNFKKINYKIDKVVLLGELWK